MTSIANYNYNKMNAFGRQRNVSANVAALNVINFNSNNVNQIPTPKSLHVQLKKLTSAPKNLRKAGRYTPELSYLNKSGKCRKHVKTKLAQEHKKYIYGVDSCSKNKNVKSVGKEHISSNSKNVLKREKSSRCRSLGSSKSCSALQTKQRQRKRPKNRIFEMMGMNDALDAVMNTLASPKKEWKNFVAYHTRNNTNKYNQAANQYKKFNKKEAQMLYKDL